jgi:hypothetical protein
VFIGVVGNRPNQLENIEENTQTFDDFALNFCLTLKKKLKEKLKD